MTLLCTVCHILRDADPTSTVVPAMFVVNGQGVCKEHFPFVRSWPELEEALSVVRRQREM